MFQKTRALDTQTDILQEIFTKQSLKLEYTPDQQMVQLTKKDGILNPDWWR